MPEHRFAALLPDLALDDALESAAIASLAGRFELAQWMQAQPGVVKVLHPALPDLATDLPVRLRRPAAHGRRASRLSSVAEAPGARA